MRPMPVGLLAALRCRGPPARRAGPGVRSVGPAGPGQGGPPGPAGGPRADGRGGGGAGHRRRGGPDGGGGGGGGGRRRRVGQRTDSDPHKRSGRHERASVEADGGRRGAGPGPECRGRGRLAGDRRRPAAGDRGGADGGREGPATGSPTRPGQAGTGGPAGGGAAAGGPRGGPAGHGPVAIRLRAGPRPGRRGVRPTAPGAGGPRGGTTADRRRSRRTPCGSSGGPSAGSSIPGRTGRTTSAGIPARWFRAWSQVTTGPPTPFDQATARPRVPLGTRPPTSDPKPRDNKNVPK